jgi:hypothetical protein
LKKKSEREYCPLAQKVTLADSPGSAIPLLVLASLIPLKVNPKFGTQLVIEALLSSQSSTGNGVLVHPMLSFPVKQVLIFCDACLSLSVSLYHAVLPVLI